jgi:hypothetical protein
MITLISTTVCPPGSYFYVLLYKGQEVRIPRPPETSSPLIGQVADGLVEFRKGNGLKRTSPTEALADVIDFTCKRLGNNPRWCIDTDMTAIQAAQIALPTSGCGSCGARI